MTTSYDPLNQYTWWGSLKHGGLLIAPARLAHYFSAQPPNLTPYWADRLRSAVQAQQDPEAAKPLAALLDTVLESVLGLKPDQWTKASSVHATWSHRLITGEQFRPRRLWQGPHDAVLPLFTDDVKQIGIGTGRRSIAKVVEWLRKSQLKIALLTNGVQWRLIHTGPDYEAWCEWDIGQWFEEGRPSEQVDALLHLLSPEALTPPEEGKPSRLIAAIQDTRKGQAELSANLGERVRLAIEHLIHSSGEVIDKLREDNVAVTPRDVYIASTRLIMRCVVVLFAEARDLLPRTYPIYNDSYSLQGLREQLDRMAGGRSKESLRQQVSAWPRLVSLFRLIYEGSEHKDLNVRRYGSALFQPGQASSTDPILRAMALFEHPKNAPSDHAVHHILELLTRAWERVPQGNAMKMVLSPIDFSDLSTEYIGILYEGLLDFQLRKADKDSPIVFLNIGDQPALPFLELNRMEPDALAKLFEKFKVQDKKSDHEGDEDSEEDEAENSEVADAAAVDGETTEEVEQTEADSLEEGDATAGRERLRQNIHAWAERAAEVAKLVKKPSVRNPKPEAQRKYEEDLDKAARMLVPRIIFPGEWFLIREGNTRKGSGTFYTRPQLAGPIARRALRELAYDGDVPRKPEEIFALKVCDPACGSGSFLLSALRFLTTALVESLFHHGRLDTNANATVARLADGNPTSSLAEESVPMLKDHPEFKERLAAKLRRHIVERCIYGVDLDGLAIELGRLALWIETMDRDLPFGFLDHKLKAGNALTGCWFDRFQDYPAMAWDRESGLKESKDWTQAIKEGRERVQRELVQFVAAQRQIAFAFVDPTLNPASVHGQLRKTFEELHRLRIDDYDERRRLYEKEFGPGTAYHQLRRAFDTWCAIWFWPADLLDDAPGPLNFLKPSAKAQTIVHELREHYHFFHWELEFPDVFNDNRHGFDAVIGNPPWEVQKPNSKEFFSNHDPLYRGYGKQEALARQQEYFRIDPRVKSAWLHYCARLKASSNWVKYAAEPFGDRVWQDNDGNDHHYFPLSKKFGVSKDDHARWKKLRSRTGCFADKNHPFQHQGSADLNTYKMFLEAGYSLLRDHGRLGLLVPSGVYSDKGTNSLRNLFLKKSRWSHLYSFQNERFIFGAVDHRFKVAAVQVEKSGEPGALLTRFRLGPGDSPEAHELETDMADEGRCLPVSIERVDQFSPSSGAILEMRTSRELEIAAKLYTGGLLLGDKTASGWGIRYTSEFHMTSDSGLFQNRVKWEDQGYRADEYGHWLKGGWKHYSGEKSILRRPRGLILSSDGERAILVADVEDVALPLYQGGMINQFDYCASAYKRIEGKRGFKWQPLEWGSKAVEPQYLMSRKNFSRSERTVQSLKIACRSISASTNARTFISTTLLDVPCGNSLGVLRVDRPHPWNLALVANSFTFDWLVRRRMGGSNLNLFVLEELAVAKPDSLAIMTDTGRRLMFPHESFAAIWREGPRAQPWKSTWALSRSERLRLRVIAEVGLALLFGLSESEFGEICRDCDRPVEFLGSSAANRSLDTKGFWRFEREVLPEHRIAVLAQVAFADLATVGLTKFLGDEDSPGWLLPETLRLADYGLGHDDRARQHQPVADALGSRFYQWQLEQSLNDSWQECERHAEILANILHVSKPEEGPEGDSVPVELSGNPLDFDLFGNPVLKKRPK